MACTGCMTVSAATGKNTMRAGVNIGATPAALEVQPQTEIDRAEVTVDIKVLVIGFEDEMRSQKEARTEGPYAVVRLRPGFAVRSQPRGRARETRRNPLVRGSHVVMLPSNEGAEAIAALLPHGVGALQVVAKKFRWQRVACSHVGEVEGRRAREGAVGVDGREIRASRGPAPVQLPQRGTHIGE